MQRRTGGCRLGKLASLPPVPADACRSGSATFSLYFGYALLSLPIRVV